MVSAVFSKDLDAGVIWRIWGMSLVYSFVCGSVASVETEASYKSDRKILESFLVGKE